MSTLAKFIETDLEKNPVSLKNDFFDQVAFSRSVFRAFKNWASSARNGDFGEFNFRMEADGFTHLNFKNEKAFPFLPVDSDQSFVEYETRIMQLTQGKRFQAIVNNLTSWDNELWNFSTQFLNEFFSHTGILARDLETALFIGNFPYTPVGVHWDGDPVLTLMIHGSKTMHAWPKRKWESLNGSRPELNYGSYIKDGITVTGNEGDWIHCPSDLYHVFEPNGLGVNFSFSFGGASLRRSVNDKAIARIGESLPDLSKGFNDFVKVKKNGQVVVAKGFVNFVSRCKENFRTSIKPMIERLWLKRLSSFSLAQPFKQISSEEGHFIQLNGQRVYVLELASKMILVFKGNEFEMKKSKAIKVQIQKLNRGGTVHRKNLNRDLFQWLNSNGAVVRDEV